MNPGRFLLVSAASLLRQRSRHRPQRNPSEPRILVIRRNRMGDMLCTLPLLQALRRHFPKAYLTVACDPTGAPIAEAFKAVDAVIILCSGGNRWLSRRRDADRLRGFDWVIAAKGGFDRRLAALARGTRGAIRIGFEPRAKGTSVYYTDPVALPTDPLEHQVETLLRLLAPIGITRPTRLPWHLELDLPEAATNFAEAMLAAPPLSTSRRFVLINISSTARLRFRPEDFLEVVARLLATPDLAVGLVAAPADQPKARELGARAGSERVAALATPGPLELAALIKRASMLLTPEGGAAHLAAAVDAPAVVLWSEGPFEKWRSRGEDHVFILPEHGEATLGVDRVWAALEPWAKGERRPRRR